MHPYIATVFFAIAMPSCFYLLSSDVVPEKEVGMLGTQSHVEAVLVPILPTLDAIFFHLIWIWYFSSSTSMICCVDISQHTTSTRGQQRWVYSTWELKMKASICVKPSTWPVKQRHQHSSFIQVLVIFCLRSFHLKLCVADAVGFKAPFGEEMKSWFWWKFGEF